MKKFERIEREIRKGWGSDPSVEICCKILNFAATSKNGGALMLTYADIEKLTGAKYDDERLNTALAILVYRFSVLELGFVFFDDKNEPHYLDEHEKADFVQAGELSHPHSGELIKDAKTKVFTYYTAEPLNLLEEVLS